MLLQSWALRHVVKCFLEVETVRPASKPLHNIGEETMTGELPKGRLPEREVTRLKKNTQQAQNRVLVLDKNKQPLMPCHPARARELMRKGRAAVYRRFPFTIILKDREGGQTQPAVLKFDPGSKKTGIAVVADFQRGKRCIFAAELEHRGEQIKKALEKRRNIRRSRRGRKTRYRKARFENRRRPQGWLAPSLQSRVDNIASWTQKFRALVPISGLSVENVRFDTHKLVNPEVEGIEYQQGTLFGYEVKEYLLDKWGRKCAYCGKQNVPLQVEHMTPKSRGGSNRVDNLTLACEKCNQKKSNQTAEEFGFPELRQKADKPLRSAAVVNSTRPAILRRLESTGLLVETGSGGQTKFNRSQQGYAKEHWLDAMCIGDSGRQVFVETQHEVLEIKAMGRGSRQMCRVDRFGFPRTGAKKKQKRVGGFQTGDIVKAVVTKGKKQGRYEGRVAVRSSGNFNIKGRKQTTQGIAAKYCKTLQKIDGYTYNRRTGVSSPL